MITPSRAWGTQRSSSCHLSKIRIFHQFLISLTQGSMSSMMLQSAVLRLHRDLECLSFKRKESAFSIVNHIVEGLIEHLRLFSLATIDDSLRDLRISYHSYKSYRFSEICCKLSRSPTHQQSTLSSLHVTNWSNAMEKPPIETWFRQKTATVSSRLVLNSSNQVPLVTIECSFHSLFKVLFTFPSQYLCAIGISPIFSLGS